MGKMRLQDLEKHHHYPHTPQWHRQLQLGATEVKVKTLLVDKVAVQLLLREAELALGQGTSHIVVP